MSREKLTARRTVRNLADAIQLLVMEETPETEKFLRSAVNKLNVEEMSAVIITAQKVFRTPNERNKSLLSKRRGK
jgi:hypothetical protein